MHIVIVNRWPRFDNDPVRWDNELTRYEEFVDHKSNKVSYIVDSNGDKGVLIDRDNIAGYEQINDVNIESELEQACRNIIEQHGRVDVLIALSEFTLEIAARVRETLSIPGPRLEQVKRYRDKVCMKQHIQAAGLAAPAFYDADRADLFAQIDKLNFPIILKPRNGAASIGVKKIEDIAELKTALIGLDLASFQVEEFVDGDIYHIDGYADQSGKVIFQVVSKYVNDCLEFSNGSPLGSFTVGDKAIVESIESFSNACCKILAIQASPFHLEVFWQNGQPVFLEIGARVGGAEVPHLINKLYGVNLYEYWLKELSGASLPDMKAEGCGHGGWLVFPKPEDKSHKVNHISSLKTDISTIWRELIPPQGYLLEPGGSYDALHCGRFIFLAEEAATVEQDIGKAISSFQCDIEPVA